MGSVDPATLRGELLTDALEERARLSLLADGVDNPDADQIDDEMRRIAEDDAVEAEAWERAMWLGWGW